MTSQSYGSVVAMEFKARPSISFADIVEEFDVAFQMVDSRTRSLTWECDDVALVDRDYVRVALGWLPSSGKGKPWHLIIAVGSAPDEDLSKIEISSYEFLADRILDRTSEFLPSTAVLRGEASQPVGRSLVETLFDLLRTDTSERPSDNNTSADIVRGETEDDYADMVDSLLPPWSHSTNDQNVYSKDVFDEVEEKLVAQNKMFLLSQAECSQPLRLTIHTLALSLCLYVPPLGAAMFAYTMMRDIFPVAASAI